MWSGITNRAYGSSKGQQACRKDVIRTPARGRLVRARSQTGGSTVITLRPALHKMHARRCETGGGKAGLQMTCPCQHTGHLWIALRPFDALLGRSCVRSVAGRRAPYARPRKQHVHGGLAAMSLSLSGEKKKRGFTLWGPFCIYARA